MDSSNAAAVDAVNDSEQTTTTSGYHSAAVAAHWKSLSIKERGLLSLELWEDRLSDAHSFS